MSKIKVGEHIKIIPGFPFNSALFNNDGDGLPLIRIRDLLTSKIETYYRGEFPKEYLIEEGDILIGMDGDFHIVKWKNKTKALLNQRIMKVAQKDGAAINIEYFYYFLFPFLSDVWEKTTATTVKHLSTYDVSEAEVEFPKFEVQSKIAKILSTADTVIEKTQAAIAKYKAIKQGMLQDLFTRGIDLNTNKLRPRYQDAPELYKESKLGMIPREWDDDVLGNIISVSSGEGLTQENIKPGIHLIYGGNGINGSHSEYLFEDSKLIIGRVGEYCGNAYITKPFSWVTDNALVVTPLKKVFLMNFWQYYLNFLDLNSLAFVGAQPVITGGLINKVVVKEIPEDEQILIAERLKATDKKLQTEQTYLQKMQSLKKGLMEDLLSGKKQVKVSEPLMVTD